MSVNDHSYALFFKNSRHDGSTDENIDYTEKLKTAIEVQMIDTNLYMSKELWLPTGGRSVFGGQIIAQALNAAYDTVPQDFFIHSLHAYFILACNPEIPVIYSVQKIRDGRSFATRIVKATQKGKVTFVCSFSFTTPEKGVSLDHQEDMPMVPDPETLPSDLVLLNEALAAYEHIPKKVKQRALNRVQEVQLIEYRATNGHTFEELVTGDIKPNPSLRRWFKSRGVLDDDMRFHACVLAWASDNEFVSTAGAAHGHTFKSQSVGMIASLDHAMWFHVPTRADEWVFYDTYSPRTNSGRGMIFGKMYTRNGTLVATTAQEGVIRLTGSAQEKLQKAQEELQKELLQNLSNSKL